MTPGCSLLMVAILATLAGRVMSAKKQRLDKASEDEVKKLKDIMDQFYLALESFEDSVENQMDEAGVTLPPETAAPSTVATQPIIKAAGATTAVGTIETTEATAEPAEVTTTFKKSGYGQESSEEEESSSEQNATSSEKTQYGETTTLHRTMGPRHTIPPLQSHRGAMYTKPGTTSGRCYCEEITEEEASGDHGYGGGDKAGGGKSSKPDKAGGGKSSKPDKAGGGGSSTPDKAGGGKSSKPDKAGGGGSSKPDKAGGGGSSTPDKAGGGGSSTPDKAGSGGSRSREKGSGGGSSSGGKGGGGGSDYGDKKPDRQHGPCFPDLKNIAAKEGAVDFLMDVDAQPCDVAWTIVPTSDEDGQFSIIDGDCNFGPNMAELYDEHPNGITIRQSTSDRNGETISSSGLYLTSCNMDGSRAGAKFVVVRSGPDCSCTRNISTSCVRLSCGVDFADGTIHPIPAIMTWYVNGEFYMTDSPYKDKLDTRVWTAISIIEISDIIVNDYKCVLTFGEPTDIMYDFIATNAPEYSDSCSSHCEDE